MSSKFILGIDLGTTNSVVAYVPRDAEEPQVQLLPVPQLVAAGTTEDRTSLPSFAYVPTAGERSGPDLALPWDDRSPVVVGQWARQRAAETPDRTIGAAKSWLCHHRVDRRQPILPWNGPAEIEKLSPVTASQRFLEHLLAAWEYAFPDAPVAEQQVVLTVPASFDPVARELTREAALAAGVPPDFVLLEEPQAALYAWLGTIGDRWRDVLRVGESVLVCDVGGGTTDLTMVRVEEDQGGLVLQRVAVGDHLLVGGDNMDLAIAHLVGEQFAQQGVQLNPWQSVSLWHSCRNAKELLLTDGGPDTQPVSVLGRGSKLIGGTVSVDVDRSRVIELLVEGFLPRCQIDERPEKARVSGFREIGLPFESDPRITRHLASFLSAHATDGSAVAVPKHVLFNGGVFKAEVLRRRLLDCLQAWGTGDAAIHTLEGVHDLDYAVARGAAFYGWSKEHGGVRIRGGVPRAYYVGIETAGLAIPGAPRPLRALCVVPFGMEEGTETDVPSAEIGLVLGEPAQFRFFSSTVRKDDRPGDVLDTWQPEELVETDPLEATLTTDMATDDTYVPIKFRARITELGVFELWCVGTRIPGPWKLEFDVRQHAQTPVR